MSKDEVMWLTVKYDPYANASHDVSQQVQGCCTKSLGSVNKYSSQITCELNGRIAFNRAPYPCNYSLE